MIVKFIEVYKDLDRYKMREVGVNPDFVVCTRNDNMIRTSLSEGNLPEGLDTRQEFTKIILDRGHGYAITVVGNTEVVNKQLNQRKLLKG